MINLYKKNEVSISLPDSASVLPQKSFIRRWNRLFRLQKTLVYIGLIGIVTIFLIVYLDKNSEKNPDKEPLIVPLVLNDSLQIPNEIENELKMIDHKLELNEKKRPKQFNGPQNDKQLAVIDAFKHAWKGYQEYAWGHDNLKPISGLPSDWFSLGLTIVDSLDTAYIMQLTEEYEQGTEWVAKELSFDHNKDVNLFEVTIRVLGALLANYHLTYNQMFLDKAIDLGDRLLGAFNSASGIPYSDVNLQTKKAHAPDWSLYSSTAEVTTLQLEFRALSRASNNPIYEETAAKVSEKIHKLTKKHGLVPIFINPISGTFLPYATITLGARGDSYYEYLLKQWIQTGQTIDYLADDYMDAMEGVRELLAKRSSPNKLLFIGELTSGSDNFNPKMDHLTCFLPGTLALGVANGMPRWHMKFAEELMSTCYQTYATHPTFLAPEITHFNMGNSATTDMFTKPADAHNLLRPEYVESLWYMYQITGNTTYQEWGWKIFQAFEKYAKVEKGYTSLNNVRSENTSPRDMMETFFMSETLKYLYLLFSDDRYLLDLNGYVITSEAHALPIYVN